MRGLIGLVVFVAFMQVTPAFAQSRPAPEATQHALDEIANAIAQGKITPTPTLSPTPRPSTATPTLVPPTPTATVVPTDVPVEPTATPLPIIPAPLAGADAMYGYTRPLDGDGLELALPQGRWLIVQASGCDPQVSVWSVVALTTLNTGEVDIASSDAWCGLVSATWQSDAPCAMDDEGICDLLMDQSYQFWLSTLPAPTPEPTDIPATPTPIVVTRVVQAPAPPPRVVQAPAPPAPTAEVIYVEIAPQLTATPIPTSVPVSIVTATPTETPIPITPAFVVIPTPTDQPTPVPFVAAVDASPASDPLTADLFLSRLGIGGMLIVIAGIFLWAWTAKDNQKP